MAETFLAPSRVGSNNGVAITGENERKVFTGAILSIVASPTGSSIYNINSSSSVLNFNKGDIVEVTGCSNADNNGRYRIINIDKENNAIGLDNLSAINEPASTGSVSFEYTIRLLHVKGV